jgi:hypothetical protein
MGVAVENDVHLLKWFGRRDMDKVDVQPSPGEIEGQGPIRAGIAIAANDFERLATEAELIEDPFAADIPEVPDFAGFGYALGELVGKFVVGVRDDCDSCGFQGKRGELLRK